ncbi:MAG: hypothetical protein E7324_01485 [Clostridiales bacterium]|nr:hypothetical protein [Clostridiales bacterium]
MRKMNFLLMLILCFVMVFPARAELTEGSRSSRVLSVEEGVEFTISKPGEWTFVTLENMEEHMALLMSLGETEAEIRARFSDGTILFEAYHPKLKNGRYRVQVFEDAFTHNVWHLDDLTKKQYIALGDELEEHYFQGYLDLIRVEFESSRARDRYFEGAYNAYPPYSYESGYYNLTFYNGKAYFCSYSQKTQASQKKHIKADGTYDRVGDLLPGMAGRGYLKGQRLSPVADLMPDDSRMILNVPSGSFTFTGVSEKKADVFVKIGDRQWVAEVDSEGRYTADIQLQPGKNEIIAVANKADLSENTLSHFISADDGMATLILTQYPYGDVIRDKIMVSGQTSPGAKVTIKIDENAPEELTVKEDGTFSQKIQAEDWIEHTIEITASENGKEDCTARFSFIPSYEDASKGISAYRKTLTEGLTAKKISAKPADHVGGRIKLEVYTKEVERTDGRLILKGNINKNKDQPIILVCEGYLQDEILDKMILTVYGEVIEPSLTDDAIPRLHVEYISYLKKIYRK